MAAQSSGRTLKRSKAWALLLAFTAWMKHFFKEKKLILVTKIAIRIENVRSRIYSWDDDCDGNENSHTLPFLYNHSKVTSCGAWELNSRF
jgi:putative alpha-1,2-mannosidase